MRKMRLKNGIYLFTYSYLFFLFFLGGGSLHSIVFSAMISFGVYCERTEMELTN